ASFAFMGLSLSGQGEVSIAWVIAMCFAIALSELMIGPAVYSFCSEIATERNHGMCMGLVPIGFSLASAFGGFFAKWMALDDAPIAQSLSMYQSGFLSIGWILLVTSIILWLGLSLLSKKRAQPSVAEL